MAENYDNYRMENDLWIDSSTGNTGWAPKGVATPEGSTFRKATPAEESDYAQGKATTKAFHTPEGKAFSAAAGAAANVPLLGAAVPWAADKALGTDGITAEAMLKAKEINPGYYQAGGVGMQVLLAGKAGSLGATSTAGRIGAQGLVNAGLGMGNEINEGILGDPKITASSVLKRGVIDFGLGAAGAGFGELLGKGVSKIIESRLPTASKFTAAAEKAAAALKDTVTDVAPKVGSTEIASAIAKKAMVPASAEAVVTAIVKESEHASQVVQELSGKTAATAVAGFEAIPKATVLAAPEIQAVGSLLNKATPEVLAALPPGTASTLVNVGKQITEATTTAEVYGAMSAAKKSLAAMPESAIGKSAIQSLEAGMASPVFGETGTQLLAMEKAAQRLETATANAKGLDAKSLANRVEHAAELHNASHAASEAASEFAVKEAKRSGKALSERVGEKGFKHVAQTGMSEAINAGVAAGAFSVLGPAAGMGIGFARKLVETISDHTWNVLSKSSGSTLSNISKQAAALATASTKVAKAALVVGPSAVLHSYEDRESDYKKKLDKIKELATDPSKLQQALVGHIGPVANSAPKTAVAIAETQARTVNFLFSKIPPIPTSFMGKEWKPSEKEMSDFNRLYGVATDPTSIMNHAVNGTLTPDMVQAVRACHPALYQVMVQSVMSETYKNKDTMPYQSRVMAAMLVGSDLDGTMKPLNVQMMQAMHQAAGQQGQGNDRVGPSQQGLSAIDVGSRTAPNSANRTEEKP